MKICLISDLHCQYQQNESSLSNSLLISNRPRIPATQHPVVAMIQEVKRDESIKSDILLCLGDLGNKADKQGIASAWTFVKEIKEHIGAKLLLGIPGNHDINSKNSDGEDAFSYIKNFHECYPTEDDDLNNKFWEFGYCIVKHENILILMINTVHDHKDTESAKKTSLVSSALERIEREIHELVIDNYDYRVCILHHHPIKHSNIKDYKDVDSIENGDNLINLLNKYSFNVIVHGHKHQPRIVEYTGLPIFAVGSFSSFEHLQGTGLNTMFHVLELFSNSKKGIINSWEYDIKNGWRKNYNLHFPPKIGFGAVLDISTTAKKINKLFQDNKKQPMFYEKIIETIPDVEYLMPEKLIQLGMILKRDYGIQTNPEYPLMPTTITEFLN